MGIFSALKLVLFYDKERALWASNPIGRGLLRAS